MTDSLSPFSSPRISRAQFARVMRACNSPAAAQTEADACYAAIADAGVDPAIALGFALKEHSLAWLGVSARTRGWGNVTTAALVGNVARVRSIGADGRFAMYASYTDGAADWAEYLYYRYHQRGIVDLAAVIAIYAPSSDGNDPAGYAATIRRLVPMWIAQDPEPIRAPDPWAAWGDAHPLPPAQRGYAIPQAWLADGQLGAAESDEIPAPWGAVRLFARGAVLWQQPTNTTKVYR